MKTQNLISNTLNPNAFFQVNKSIAKALSNDAAILLSELIYKRDYFIQRSMLIDGTYFFTTNADLQEVCNLSREGVAKIIKQLRKIGFISTVMKGIPSKMHFVIEDSNIANFLNTATTTLSRELIDNRTDSTTTTRSTIDTETRSNGSTETRSAINKKLINKKQQQHSVVENGSLLKEFRDNYSGKQGWSIGSGKRFSKLTEAEQRWCIEESTVLNGNEPKYSGTILTEAEGLTEVPESSVITKRFWS